jgi:molybdate transport system substrate-binding protein
MPKGFIGALTRRTALVVSLSLCLLGMGALGVRPATADTVTVFAAASLKAALDDVVRDFERTADHQIQVSYAGSSALARQIEQGAPANIFISANLDWMDRLEAQGMLEPGTRAALLTNTLVLIAPVDEAVFTVAIEEFDIIGQLKGRPLAMAFVEAVPAGLYGKAALRHLGMWDAVAPHVAQTDSVRLCHRCARRAARFQCCDLPRRQSCADCLPCCCDCASLTGGA